MVEVVISTFNNSGTPLRVVGNSVLTISRFKVSIVLYNDRGRVVGYIGRGGVRLGRARVCGASTPTIRVDSSSGYILERGTGSDVKLNFSLLGSNRNSTFISTKGANTVAINTALVAGEVGNMGEPYVTSIVPDMGGPFLLLSYNTGIRYHPRFLSRFNGLNDLCVRRVLNYRGPHITLIGGNSRRAGNAHIIGRTCTLVGGSSCGFINGVRTERVPFNSTSIIITSNFSNGLILGVCRNITGTLVGNIGSVFGGGIFAVLSTINIVDKVGGVGGRFSCGRCNNTILLNIHGPIIGTRNSTSTHAFGGTVGRTI